MSGIHIFNFGGGTVYSVEDVVVSDSQIGGASGSFRLRPDGTMGFSNAGPDHDWADPPVGTPGNNWHVRLDINSGSPPTFGQNVGVWLALTQDRQWGWANTTAGTTLTASGTLSISSDGGSTTYDSGNVSVSVAAL